MRPFRLSERPGEIRFTRHPDFQAILLIAVVEALLFVLYYRIPFEIRIGLLLAFSLVAAAVLWPRIVGEKVILNSRAFNYTRGLWPLELRTELEWRHLDTPRILNAGVRGWRGPIAFNDSRTGHQFRLAAGLPPSDCHKLLMTVEQFQTTIS